MDDLISKVIFRSSLTDTFGEAIVKRALELAKGQSPYANMMPYIYQAMEEARQSSHSASACPYGQKDCESTKGGVCVCAMPETVSGDAKP